MAELPLEHDSKISVEIQCQRCGGEIVVETRLVLERVNENGIPHYCTKPDPVDLDLIRHFASQHLGPVGPTGFYLHD